MYKREPRRKTDTGYRPPERTIREALPASVEPDDPDEHDGWEAIRPRRSPLPFVPTPSARVAEALRNIRARLLTTAQRGVPALFRRLRVRSVPAE